MIDARFNFAEIADARRGPAEPSAVRRSATEDTGLANVWPRPGAAAEISAKLNSAAELGPSRAGQTAPSNFAEIETTRASRLDLRRGSLVCGASSMRAATAPFNFAEIASSRAKRAPHFNFAEIANVQGGPAERSDVARAELAGIGLVEIGPARQRDAAEISAKLSLAVAIGSSRVGQTTWFNFADIAKTPARRAVIRRSSSTRRGSGAEASTARFNFAEMRVAISGRTNTTVIFINQLRQKIGIVSGNQELAS